MINGKNINTYSSNIEVCCEKAAAQKHTMNRAIPKTKKDEPISLLKFFLDLKSLYIPFLLTVLDAKKNFVINNCSGIKIKNKSKSNDKNLEITIAIIKISDVDTKTSLWSLSKLLKILANSAIAFLIQLSRSYCTTNSPIGKQSEVLYLNKLFQ